MYLKRIIIDLNTQRDFLCPDGAVRVLNRRLVLPPLRMLMRWARRQRVPVISTVEAHRPGEPTNSNPRHCIDGTTGQQKLAFTLLPNRVLVEADNTHSLPLDLLDQHGQVIFRKRTRDVMNNPKADRFFSELRAEMMYVFGMTVENTVKPFVLGLLARRQPVTVIRDACGWWDPADADMAFRQMVAKGAQMLPTGELVSEITGPSRQAAVLRRFSRRRSSTRSTA
jgi:nicotinamidase-related amidase